MKDRIIVGYDLGPASAQISYCTYENQIPETLAVIPGTEKYSIPTMLCKRNNVNQWFYGDDAVRHANQGDGTLVTDIVEKALAGEQIEIDGTEFDAVALLTLFIKRSLSKLSAVFNGERVEGIMFTCKNLDTDMVEVLKGVVSGLGLKTKYVCFQSHAESFYQYMLHEPEELWVRDVLLFDYSSDIMKVYRMECNRRTTPIVSFIEEAEFSFFACNDFPEEDYLKEKVFEQMDSRFLSVLEECCEGRLISTAYLIGDGFAESWMKNSLQYLCRGRRVFQGNNMYSKGACHGMMERIIPSKIGKQHVFLGAEKLKSNIGMKVFRQGKDSYLALLDAGISWHEANNEVEFHLLGENYFDITITPLNGRDVQVIRVTLEGLPIRKTPTRLYLNISMTDESKVKLYVEDLGFGEIEPSGYQKWTEYFEV